MKLPDDWRRIAAHAIQHRSGNIRISGAGIGDDRKYTIWTRRGEHWDRQGLGKDLAQQIEEAEKLI